MGSAKASQRLKIDLVKLMSLTISGLAAYNLVAMATKKAKTPFAIAIGLLFSLLKTRASIGDFEA